MNSEHAMSLFACFRRYLAASALPLLLGLVAAQGGCKKSGSDTVAPPAETPVDVETLLSQMTLEEKIGQMTQAERGALVPESDIRTYFIGSVLSGGGSTPSANNAPGWADMVDRFQAQALQTRLKIPIIYGIDAVHGHNNVYGATIFPHNIGLGCTRDSGLVRRVAAATAEEVAGTGIHWTFSPCIAVPRDERWGRTYEGFGETPDIVAPMAWASVQGYQSRILACAKHYVGDGGTRNGRDQGNTEIDEATLRAIHLPGYVAAIGAGAGSIMASFSSWNGSKMHGNRYLLTTMLKGELGFEGFVVSDWAGIDQISPDYAAAVETAINAGIDMAMVPNRHREFISKLKELVLQGRVSMSRIDDAVRRILKQKFRLGLFQHPQADRSLMGTIGTDLHRLLAREAVRKSVVLLKNQRSVLPIGKSLKRIHMAGALAQDLGAQCGGWTISWQGGSGAITLGTTLLQAVESAVLPVTHVTYDPEGTNGSGADVGIVVVGERPYAEGNGDRSSLALDSRDLLAIRNMKAAGIPLVVLLVSGRPMIIQEALDLSDAFLALWLPGTEGAGVADVLFGDYPPTGKLSHSWPRSMSQVPINFGDPAYDPLFPLGFGLTY